MVHNDELNQEEDEEQLKKMKERKGMDWKSFSAIDINQFDAGNIESKMLLDIVTMIINCSLDDDFDTLNTDANLLKAFKLSQKLLIYYRDQSESPSKTRELRFKLQTLQNENEKLRTVIELHNQALGTAPINGNGLNIDGQSWKELFPCPQCPKTFRKESFLDSHIGRRHPVDAIDSMTDLPLIKKIAEYHSMIGFNSKIIDQISADINTIKSKLESTENQLLEESELRIKLEEKMETINKITTESSQSAFQYPDVDVTINDNDDHLNDGHEQLRGASPDRSSSPSQSKFEVAISSNTRQLQGLQMVMARFMDRMSAVNHVHDVHDKDLMVKETQLKEEFEEKKKEIKRLKKEEKFVPKDGQKLLETNQQLRSESPDVQLIKDDVTLNKYLKKELKNLKIDPRCPGIDEKTYQRAIKTLTINWDDEEWKMREKVLKRIEKQANQQLNQQKKMSKSRESSSGSGDDLEPKPEDFKRSSAVRRTGRFKTQTVNEKSLINPEINELKMKKKESDDENKKTKEVTIKVEMYPESDHPLEQLEDEVYNEREIRAPSPVKVPKKSNLASKSGPKKAAKRRISFAENRIEISPDDSPDEGHRVENEIQIVPDGHGDQAEGGHDEVAETIESTMKFEEENFFSSDEDSDLEKEILIKNLVQPTAPPMPAPRAARPQIVTEL